MTGCRIAGGAMRCMRCLLAAGLAAAMALPAAWAGQPAPGVVVTIPPVHGLVADVMAGVGTPRLLLPGGVSPHAYALRPSDSRALHDAALIVWVGGDLETFLEKPLRTLAAKARILRLSDAPGVALLPNRPAGTRVSDGRERQDASGHGSGHDHGNDHDHGHGFDPHLWLAPSHARAIVAAAAAALAEVDPANAAHYRANAARTQRSLDSLETEIAAALRPVRDVPFVVFHDAFQYFEKAFGLRSVGALALSPERKPGARRLIELRRTIRETGARCAFAEPQFSPSLIATLLSGTGAQAGSLDALGATVPPGPGAYHAIMRDLASDVVACLGPNA